MGNVEASHFWHTDDLPESVLKVLQSNIANLVDRGFEVILEEREDAIGSWPYTDIIHLSIYTITGQAAYAVAQQELGQNDGTMETWTSLDVILYGEDPFLLDFFNEFFRKYGST